MKINRIGETAGRFPAYRLIVDGTDLGMVRRRMVKGKDGNLGRSQPSYDVWSIQGTDCATQARAEKLLIERGLRFGYIFKAKA